MCIKIYICCKLKNTGICVPLGSHMSSTEIKEKHTTYITYISNGTFYIYDLYIYPHVYWFHCSHIATYGSDLPSGTIFLQPEGIPFCISYSMCLSAIDSFNYCLCKHVFTVPSI